MEIQPKSPKQEVAPVPANIAVTMSSREIAELCEKRHAHVVRDIENMLAKLGLSQPKFGSTYFDAQNKERKQYLLPRDLAITLVSGYDIVLRHRIVTRLDELEAQNSAKPLDYSDPSVVVGVITSLQGQVFEKQKQIEAQGERLTMLDRLEGAEGTMCITDAAKTLSVRPKDLFALMAAHRWIFKRAGSKNWLAYQDKRAALLMDHDDHLYIDNLGRERVATRALVTAKGLVKLAEILEAKLH